MNFFQRTTWSPYWAGALAGLVLCLSVLIAGKYFGASTTFVRSAGLIEKTVATEYVANSDYFTKTKIKIDWQMLFVAGIIVGSLAASKIAGTFASTPVPPMWRRRFGDSAGKRYLVAFAGGIVALFGARMAGG